MERRGKHIRVEATDNIQVARVLITILDEEGRACAVAASSAMDLSLIREVLGITVRAAAELGAAAEEGEGAGVSKAAASALDRLRPGCVRP